MDLIKQLLKTVKLLFYSWLVTEALSVSKPHLDCASLCTEVLFNRHPPVKQLNVLPSNSASSVP